MLNEALLAASKSQEEAVRSDASSAEPSALTDTADALNDSEAQGDVEIGPQERPPEVMQDGDATVVPLEVSKQPTIKQTTANRSTETERQVQSQTCDPESCRPFKMQKVALSFAEDDDTDDV